MKELDRIYVKLEAMDDKLQSVDKTLGEQAVQLKHHIYRSDLNEENIEMLRADVKPLTEFHTKFKGILGMFGAVAGIVTVVAGIVKVLEFLF